MGSGLLKGRLSNDLIKETSCLIMKSESSRSASAKCTMVMMAVSLQLSGIVFSG